jgi:hypothetical protein
MAKKTKKIRKQKASVVGYEEVRPGSYLRSQKLPKTVGSVWIPLASVRPSARRYPPQSKCPENCQGCGF